jgi:raffinose/stachyose/melibiose transport system substrate-binding protein
MKKSFKVQTAMLVILCLVFTLVANVSTPVVAKGAEKIQIRVVTSFTGDDPWKNPWQAAMKEYMVRNPNIEIIDEATPTQGEALRTKIKTDFASGNEPDVSFFFNGVDTKPLLESGKLLAWDTELKNDAAWGRNFAPSALKAVKYEGKVYALPYIGYYEGMLVNKDLFKKFKVKVPTNYNELVTAIKVFNKNKIIPLANSFVDSRYMLEYTILSAGGPKGHATAYDASWVKGLNTIKDLYKLNAFPKDALTLTDEQAQQLFKDKKAAMLVNGSWVVGGCPDKINTEVTYFPLVQGAKAKFKDIIAGCGSGWYLSKNLNAEKKGAPMAFVKYMTSPSVMAKFAAVAGVPQIKCNITSVSKAAKSGWKMENAATSLNSPIDSFLNPDAFNNMNTGIAYIITGKKTAEKVLAESKKLNKK